MIIKINNMRSPVTDTEPAFSWEYPEGEFSSQKSYRLIISAHEDFSEALCDISENTDRRENIRPRITLLPRTKYFVKIESFLENGNMFSGETYFSTGMRGEAWNARWITGHGCIKRDEALAAQYLRRDFTVTEMPCRAMLYICGLGYFEAHINGNKVGDDFLSTPYTAYDKNILYRAFDVTEMLKQGENAIGVILGNGFYNCFSVDPWQSAQAPWRDVPKLLCELHIEYKTGAGVIVSDKSWRSVEGPIIFNGIRHGEIYDARLENKGWDSANYQGSSEPCRMAKNPGAALSVMEMEPVKIRAVSTPVSVRKVKNGWLYDAGQDTAGIADITFRGKCGDEIKIRYSNRLHENGELDQESLSGFIKNYFFQTDTFIKGSDEPENRHSVFVYHGFRYIEISGCRTAPELSDIKILSLCNAFDDRGDFSTSDETVNFIQHMCVASTTSCCINTLASDTVREKTSWTGDTGLSCEQLLMNFNAVQLMKKWLSDLRDSQRPGGLFSCIVPSAGWGYNSMNGPDWSHPIVDVPWNIYIASGETDVLKENYSALLRHCDYIASMANDDIPSFGLGDWCAPFEGEAISVNMESFKCPVPVTDTAYYYSALKMAARVSEILGNENNLRKYSALAGRVKAAFRRNFFDKSTYTVSGDCQTSVSVMIYHGLAEPDEIFPLTQKLLSIIKRDGNRLDVGVLGMKAMLDVLGRYGYAGTALKLLTNPEYPSVRHWIDMGATSLWECWNGGGSRNHHMFSDISAFFYKFIAGIEPVAPAYRKIVFRPAVDCGLGSAAASVETPYGKAECGFTVVNGKTNVNITVPSSCEGILLLGGNETPLSAGIHTVTV